MLTPKQVTRLNAKVPALMGAGEVAQVLGVKQNNLNKVARLPAEIPQQLGRGRVWREDVIKDFAAERAKK